MFQTITKLFDAQAKYISFGAAVIYCDPKNVCSVYDPLDHAAYPGAEAGTTVSTE